MSDVGEAKGMDQQNPPRHESFLRAVESKTADPHHHRLLKVCRQPNTAAALEEELLRIIDEILHETE
jgi:hypothetical protein